MNDHRLPGILGEIADIAGKDAAYALLASHGGLRIDIPAKAEPDHWLSLLVGLEAASKICEELRVGSPDGTVRGVRHVIIPLGPRSLQKAARRHLAEALRSGKTVRQAARQVGVHERTAWRVKARLAGNDDQGELF